MVVFVVLPVVLAVLAVFVVLPVVLAVFVILPEAGSRVRSTPQITKLVMTREN